MAKAVVGGERGGCMACGDGDNGEVGDADKMMMMLVAMLVHLRRKA
jgi:hypothetical protein